jgi:hypothetical protein
MRWRRQHSPAGVDGEPELGGPREVVDVVDLGLAELDDDVARVDVQGDERAQDGPLGGGQLAADELDDVVELRPCKSLLASWQHYITHTAPSPSLTWVVHFLPYSVSPAAPPVFIASSASMVQ